jgi:hypothetical protein
MATDEEKARAAADKNSLGRLLVDGKLLTQPQLDAALKEADRNGWLLGRAVVELGFVKKKTMLLLLRVQKSRKHRGLFARVRNALAFADTAEQHVNEAFEAHAQLVRSVKA